MYIDLTTGTEPKPGFSLQLLYVCAVSVCAHECVVLLLLLLLISKVHQP